MKKIYVDLKNRITRFENPRENKTEVLYPNRREQLIWIFDDEKREGIAVSLLSYAEQFSKTKFNQIEGEYLAIISVLDYPDYRSEDLEIIGDSKTVIDVLNNIGTVNNQTKPYVDKIKELTRGREIKFSYLTREMNPAGFKAEGNPANKKSRDLAREFRSKNIIRNIRK
jgi:hypothetical protein